ncbi:bacteriocin immunity protein [Ligilactobacillus salivarius]|uniref:bacteriocin immunity protein n=1 Tax=Ligilactobacillus salivarius TaxID=1624 RepID=UPI002966EB11|nr:bacteriocin immunity protein [Ligilactobacillus salivarius]MDW3022840.1 bacteriocin immunity protein [Ligilactobacillus salivarius]
MEKVQELQRLVVELYDSFENDNRKGVEEIRQVLANVNEKYKTSSHSLAWTGRLVLYLQVNAVKKDLYLTPEQKDIIKELARIGKRTNLNYVYLSPVDDAKQFV